MISAIAKIAYFGTLPARWEGTRSVQFTPVAVRAATDWARRLPVFGFIKTDAFPGESGEIMVTGYKEGVCLEVVVEPDGSYSINTERYVPRGAPASNPNRASIGKWHTSVFSELLGMTRSAGNSAISPLSHQATGREYPYLKASAPSQPVAAFANTLPDFMASSRIPPSFSGSLAENTYPKARPLPR